MTTKILNILFILFLTSLFFIQCSDNPLNPMEPENQLNNTLFDNGIQKADPLWWYEEEYYGFWGQTIQRKFTYGYYGNLGAVEGDTLTQDFSTHSPVSGDYKSLKLYVPNDYNGCYWIYNYPNGYDLSQFANIGRLTFWIKYDYSKVSPAQIKVKIVDTTGVTEKTLLDCMFSYMVGDWTYCCMHLGSFNTVDFSHIVQPISFYLEKDSSYTTYMWVDEIQYYYVIAHRN